MERGRGWERGRGVLKAAGNARKEAIPSYQHGSSTREREVVGGGVFESVEGRLRARGGVGPPFLHHRVVLHSLCCHSMPKLTRPLRQEVSWAAQAGGSKGRVADISRSHLMPCASSPALHTAAHTRCLKAVGGGQRNAISCQQQPRCSA